MVKLWRKELAIVILIEILVIAFSPVISTILFTNEIQNIEKIRTSRTMTNLFLETATNNATALHLEFPENGTFIQSDYTITFRWTNVSNAANYTLQIDNSSFFNTTNLREIKGINNTEYTLTNGLPPGEWYWRVGAVFYNGDIAYSVVWYINVASRAAPTINLWQELQRLSEVLLALILLLLMIILFPGGVLTKKLSIHKNINYKCHKRLLENKFFQREQNAYELG